ncbi:ribonuclease H-like domain-containing protein [Tanacetum coccineum]
MRLKTNANALHADSSSLMVLVAKSGNPRRSSSTPHVKPWQHCFNFAKGTCRFGDGYHFVHDPNVKITPNNNVEVNASNMDELLVKLLSRLGMSNMDVKNTLTVLSGASSHLNSSITNLNTIFNMYSSISVDDSHSIPVTNTGHSILPTPVKSLHLNNVLITPHIVKNLIFVRQFVRDNNCTIEFDAFGFFVKDFMTHRVLLRCDSSGDLYPVTAPSPIPHVFLVSQHTWHQRLGHPGSEMLRRLVSNNFISCNKEKSPILCHACQLGKHVRLPFVSSTTVVNSCFDIIHSDVWTSPILSLSSYKYYVLFLDHYSQFVWVYLLVHKSDVLSKFNLFRTYVKTQFKCEIHSFQCDHGGEFNNSTFHKLFTDNGIQFRFSCPKTSQQNGKSKCTVRTINNLIRTLLFQANLPPTFWVEAFNMVVHLLNILPSTAIANEIPYTHLFGTNPDYSLLRTFGCLCYHHLYPNHKLDPRATPDILLGHASNHRGYRCFDLHTNKIILSRHVTFDETVFPYGTVSPTSAPTYNFLDDLPDINPPIIPIVSLSPNTTSQHNTPFPTVAPLDFDGPSTPNTPTAAHLQHHSQEAQSSIPLINNEAHSPTPPAKSHEPHSPAPITATQNTNPNPASVHPMVTRFRVGTNRPTQRFTLHVSSVSPLPKNYHAAFSDPNWQNVMRDEYHALIKNRTWVLVPRPPNTNIVRCMWLFRHKYLADGTLSRYKARLVANGSTQIEGIDVDETFSPVVKPGTIHTVLGLAVSRHWPIHQLDVKNAFLHGDLSETFYMHQPPGFWDSTHPDYVCLLQRSLHGLKQAPKAWFQRFASYITRVGFQSSRCDSSLFIYRQGTDTAYLLLYVDDIVLTASYETLLQQIIGSLHQEFSMTDLGMVGCNSSRTLVDTKSKLWTDGDPVFDPTFYRSLAGSLQYLTFTRPDISYGVQQIWLLIQMQIGLVVLPLGVPLPVIVCFLAITYCPGPCQLTLSRSSAEAEYRGVVNAVAETCWLQNLLRELHTPLSSATLVYYDNVSVVYLSSNPVQHQRTKHIEIDIHFVRDLVTVGQVRFLHVPSRYQFADIFTKGLPSTLFEDFRSSLNVRCPPAQTVREC